MVGKKSLSALLMVGVLAASATVTAPAFAGGRYHGGHGGGGGGNGLAIAAGILGAVAVGAIIANSAQPVYEAPQPVYYGPPPQQVYYQQAPQYYQAPPEPVYVRTYPRDPYYYRGGYYQR